MQKDISDLLPTRDCSNAMYNASRYALLMQQYGLETWSYVKQLLQNILPLSETEVRLRKITAPTFDHPRLDYYSDK